MSLDKYNITQEDVEQIISVNKNELDEVLEEHTALYDLVTSPLSEVKEKYNQLKNTLNEEYASQYLSIKNEYLDEGKKVTEKVIESEVIKNSMYKKLLKDFNEVKSDLNELERLREMMYQREASIRHLVALYSAGYWQLSNVRK